MVLQPELATMPLECLNARIALLAVTAVACAGLIFLPMTKIELDAGALYRILPSLALIFGISLYLQKRNMLKLRGLMEVLGCAILITYASIVWSYAAISLAFPLADSSLIALDNRLGFQWLDFVSAIDRLPLLEAALFAAYQSFMFQLILIPLFLVAFGSAARGYMLVAGFGLLCMAASVISIWFPALGAHVAYRVDPASLKSLNAYFGYAFLEQFHAVRNDASFRLFVDKAAGILTFPSVHAGTALLCAWAAWRSRVLKLPIGILNIAMAVSAISHGSHYLVDVLAGVALAAVIVVSLNLFVGHGRFAAPENLFTADSH